MTDWTPIISKHKLRRQRRLNRVKTLKPYYVDSGHTPTIIDLPTLFDMWPNVLTEIVKHVGNHDLIYLRQTCVNLKSHCDIEIQTRQYMPRYTQIRQFYKDNRYFYRYCKIYGRPPESMNQYFGTICPSLDLSHPYWQYLRMYSKYKKSIKSSKCIYYSYGLYKGLHDSSCGCGVYYDWFYGFVSAGGKFDNNLVLDTEIDVLLNPKIKSSLLNWNKSSKFVFEFK